MGECEVELLREMVECSRGDGGLICWVKERLGKKGVLV